ncbi:hypothetical protein ACJWDR_39580 [Streptomyces tauricus]|uniref:hypothetical protein n=1 Tax=Streptomyces tauricus TaxID=68274 RepID=UPI00387F1C46
MSELPDKDVSLDDLGKELKALRARLERRENEVSELHGQYGTLSGRLNTLHGATSGLATTVTAVDDATKKLRTDLADTRSEVSHLRAELTDLRTQYERDQAVLAANFELDRLTDEWRRKFGNRDTIRSLARGLVRQITPTLVRRGVADTTDLRNQVTEHLFHDPEFWLAHATLSVAARLDGNEELELSAMGQAQRQDLTKANLFFALAAARAEDQERAGTWMDSYLQAVQPDQLGRDFLAVLDAVASRELGDHAHEYARQAMVRWATGASPGSTAARASVDRWKPQLRALLLAPSDRYAPLDRVCGAQWQQLQEGLRLATVTTATLAHLRSEFPPPPASAPNQDMHGPDSTASTRARPYAEAAIDRLVGHLEPDEAALHTKKEWLTRFIDHRGNAQAAREEHELRLQADTEVVDFGTLLDNAVFRPSQIALGDDARRFALMQVLPNVRAAAEEIVAGSLGRRQRTVRVTIEGWHTDLPTDPSVTVDGPSLAEHLTDELRAGTENRAEAVDRDLLRRVGGPTGGLVAVVLAPFLLSGFLLWSALIIGVTCAVWGALDLNRVPAERRRIREAGEARCHSARHTLSQVLDQRINFFADWDQHVARTRELRAWDPMGK